MATKRILLTRPWSGHAAGEIIEEWDVTVDSMVRKGYGTIVPPERHPKPPAPPRLEIPGNPPVETAMLTPQTEMATAGPQQNGKGRAGKWKGTPVDKES